MKVRRRPARVVGALLCGLCLGGSSARADGEAERRVDELIAACDAEADGEGESGEGPGHAALIRTWTLEGDPAVLVTDGDGRLLYPFRPDASAEQGRVTLDAGRKLRAVASIGAEARAMLLGARERGDLRAMISFRLREQPGLPRPCTAIGGGRFLHVRVTPLWVELIPTVQGKPGKPVRALTPDGALEPSAGAVPRAALRVTVAKAAPGESEQIESAAQALRERSVTCFRPVAETVRRGTIALELAVGPTGGATEPRVMLDGVHVHQVTECVIRAARQLRFPRTERGAEVMIAVEFALAPAP